MTGIIINSPVLNPAVLRLSNGGTVGGDSDYVLMPGNVTFQFDGTDLN